MKSLIIFAFLIQLFSHHQEVKIKKAGCQVGIYDTQSDFAKNTLSFQANTLPIIHCMLFFNCPIDIYQNFDFPGKIKFKNSTDSWETINPGSIYGFIVNNHKYIYIKEFKEYLLLINESPICLYLTRVSLKAPMRLYFAHHLNDLPVPLNKHQINKFNADSLTKRVLLRLYKALPDRLQSTDKKGYDHYENIIHKYMEQLQKIEE